MNAKRREKENEMRKKIAEDFKHSVKGGKDPDRAFNLLRDAFKQEFAQYDVPFTLSHLEAAIMAIKLYGKAYQEDGEKGAAQVGMAFIAVGEELKAEKEAAMKKIGF